MALSLSRPYSIIIIRIELYNIVREREANKEIKLDQNLYIKEICTSSVSLSFYSKFKPREFEIK